METHKRGGIVLRVEGALQFVPASIAVHVGPTPRVTPIPGGPPELVGVAIHEGSIVPVVSIGSARAEMLLCQHAGELLGVIGAQVVERGSSKSFRSGRATSATKASRCGLSTWRRSTLASRRGPGRVPGAGERRPHFDSESPRPVSLTPGTASVSGGDQASPRNVRHWVT